MLRSLRKFKAIGAMLAAIGIAAPSTSTPAATHSTTQTEKKIIDNRHLQSTRKKHKHVFSKGGLELVTEYIFKQQGLSPKEYGLRYGTGASRNHKTNRHKYFA